MKGKRHREGVKTLLTLAFMWLALATMPAAFAQGAPAAGGGATTQGGAGGDQPEGANANPGSAWTSRKNYFLRFPVAEQAFNYDQVGEDGASPKDGTVQHTNPGDMVYAWPSIVPTAQSTTPTKRDQVVGDNLFKTFGYPVSDSQFQVIERYNHNRLLEQAFDPERAMWTTQTAAGMGANNAANSIGASGVNQVCQAIDYCSMYLNNFTAEAGNVWQRIRDQLFIPMAVLLLLPGAVLAQVRAIVAQGSPVLIGQEVHPFEGILRSIVAIFLIPGSFLVINYGIDVANSITFTIASEYTRLFGSNMYSDAKCAILRAVPVEQAKNRRNAIREVERPTHRGSTVWAIFEGTTLVTELRDPCAGIDEVRVKDEDVSYTKSLTRLVFNTVINTQGLAWDLACTFQMVYLYYLWCMGPIAAALWVWPVASLRSALGSWCEGVITVCFWSLFWNTVILLMACFRGVGDSGTIVQSALLMLAIASVQSAFDFGGLASNLVQMAMQTASAVAGQMNGGAGGGGAGKSHANAGGGHAPSSSTNGGSAGAGTTTGGSGTGTGTGTGTGADTSGSSTAATGTGSGSTAGGADAAKALPEAGGAANTGAGGISLGTGTGAGAGTGGSASGSADAGTGSGSSSASGDASTGAQASAQAGSPEAGLPPSSEAGKGKGKGSGGGGEGSGEGGAGGAGGAGSAVSAAVSLALNGGSSVSNVNATNNLPPGVGGLGDGHLGTGTGGIDPNAGGKGTDLTGAGTVGSTGATGTASLDANGKPINPLDGTGIDSTLANGTATSGTLGTNNATDAGLGGAGGQTSLPPSSGLTDNLANPTGDGTTHGLHSPVDNSGAHSFTTTDANGNTTLDTGKVGPLPPINGVNAGDPNASLAQHTTQDIMAMGGVSNDKLNLALQHPGGADYADVRNATGVAPEVLKAGLDGNSAAATVAAAGFGETPMAQHFAGTGISSTADVSTAMAQSLDPGVASRAALSMDTGAASQMLSSNGASQSFAQAVDNYRSADGTGSISPSDPRVASYATSLPVDSGTAMASQSDFSWSQAGGGTGSLQTGGAPIQTSTGAVDSSGYTYGTPTVTASGQASVGGDVSGGATLSAPGGTISANLAGGGGEVLSRGIADAAFTGSVGPMAGSGGPQITASTNVGGNEFTVQGGAQIGGQVGGQVGGQIAGQGTSLNYSYDGSSTSFTTGGVNTGGGAPIANVSSTDGGGSIANVGSIGSVTTSGGGTQSVNVDSSSTLASGGPTISGPAVSGSGGDFYQQAHVGTGTTSAFTGDSGQGTVVGGGGGAVVSNPSPMPSSSGVSYGDPGVVANLGTGGGGAPIVSTPSFSGNTVQPTFTADNSTTNFQNVGGGGLTQVSGAPTVPTGGTTDMGTITSTGGGQTLASPAGTGAGPVTSYPYDAGSGGTPPIGTTASVSGGGVNYTAPAASSYTDQGQGTASISTPSFGSSVGGGGVIQTAGTGSVNVDSGSGSGNFVQGGGAPVVQPGGGTVANSYVDPGVNYGSQTVASTGGGGTAAPYFAGNNDVPSAQPTITTASIDPPQGTVTTGYGSTASTADYYRGDGGGGGGQIEPQPYIQTASGSGPVPVDGGGGSTVSYPAPDTSAGVNMTTGSFAENTGGGHVQHQHGGHQPAADTGYLYASNETASQPYTPGPSTSYTSTGSGSVQGGGGGGQAPQGGAPRSLREVLGGGSGAAAAFAMNKGGAKAPPPEKPAEKAAPPTEVASAAPPKKGNFGPATNARRQSGKSQAEIDEENRRLMAQMGEIPKAKPEDLA